MPLVDIAPKLLAMLCRIAINVAPGSAKSSYAHLAKWRKRKEQWEC